MSRKTRRSRRSAGTRYPARRQAATSGFDQYILGALDAPVLSVSGVQGRSPAPSSAITLRRLVRARQSAIRRSKALIRVSESRKAPFRARPRSGFSAESLIPHWTDDTEARRIPPPRGSSICSRRAERREVIFAKRLTGLGASAKRKRTTDSSIHCGVH